MAKTKFLDYTGLAKLVEKIKNTYVNKNEQYEANLKWGGGNFANSFGPIDGAMVPELGANRFAFGNPRGITVEYSNDGGNTWHDYGAIDEQKLRLTTTGTSFSLGKHDVAPPSLSNMLRITFDVTLDKGIICYTNINKFIINVSTAGMSNCYCTVQAAANTKNITYNDIATKVPINGWSGYNVINVPNFRTCELSTNENGYDYRYIRFIFGADSIYDTKYYDMCINKIYAYGGMGWRVPSNLASRGSLYSYDESQNATFPANVTATNFIGTLQGNANSASKLGTATVGGATKPMYLSGGTPTECTYTLAQNVTSASKLTDTTYSASTGLSLSKDNKFSINAATSSTIGGVKIGNNISITSGTISLTKGNVVNALGYTPPTADTNTTYTFTNGTDGTFTVKASNSTKAQTISVGKTASASTADNAVNAQTAETANKLSVNAGSDMTPIYFKDGVPKPCDSTLGVNINGRANYASLADKLPINAGSASVDDVLVIGNYIGGPIYMGGGVGPGKFTPTDIIEKDGDYYLLNVSKANTANSASKLNIGTTGTPTKPVYFNNGVPATCTYELNKTVPSNAVFTDTKYTLSGDGTNKVTITDSNKSSQTITINDVQRATVATYAKKYSYNGMDSDFVYDVVDGGNHYIRCKDAKILRANGTNLNNYEFIINADGKGGCYIYDSANAKGTTWGPDGIVFDKAPANSLVAAKGTFATAISDTDIKNEINSAIDWTQAL